MRRWTLLDAVRSPSFPRVDWLDLKLAARMLVRHPGLTIVGGLALAIGIPVALAPVQLALALNAPLPFHEPHRIVGLEYLDLTTSHDRQPAFQDFKRWRDGSSSFEPLAAARRRTEALISDHGAADVATGAEMTASAFAVARVAPLLGRTLIEEDEAAGAEPVVVIGHTLWKNVFGSAPDVVGRAIRCGATRRTIVGVMPEGFQFPYRDAFWVPLQEPMMEDGPARSSQVWVFGRLREGVSRHEALSELRTIDRRIAADYPDTYAHLRPDITEFAYVVTGLSASFNRTYPMYVLSLLLLAVACGNVGTLMLARTAARSHEIAVRHALGAGRGRIVMQLFVESLLLCTLAGAVGLALAELLIVPRLQVFESAMPHWFDLSIKPSTVVVAGGLAVFSAVVSGLLPALKITGKRAYQTLQRQSAGGSGLRFGAGASALIVAEVAIAVAGLSGVSSVARGAFRERSLGEGIAAEEYLTTELRLVPIETPAEAMTDQRWKEASTRLAALQGEAVRRLSAEPGVRSVSFASVLPGMRHGRARVELEGDDTAADPTRGEVVNLAAIDRSFLQTLGQRVLTGRDFDAGDVTSRGGPVLVNRSFVERVLQGRHPLGRRIRYARTPPQPPGPWHEIVGVVNDLGMNIVDPDKAAGVYHVVAHGQVHPVHLLVRVGGDAATFAPGLRTSLAEIQPALVPDMPVRLDRVFSHALSEARVSAVVFTVIAVIAILLSAAALYALMAFSVSQRTREIAIRTTLGAPPFGIVRSVLSRAVVQLLIGVVLGAGLAVLIVPEVLNSSTITGNWRQMLIAVSTAMTAIGLLACVVPTRRALRIQPAEALKECG